MKVVNTPHYSLLLLICRSHHKILILLLVCCVIYPKVERLLTAKLVAFTLHKGHTLLHIVAVMHHLDPEGFAKRNYPIILG